MTSWMTAICLVLLLLLAGCGGGGESNSGAIANENTIGAVGGSVQIADPASPVYLASVSIPAQALSEDKTISNEKVACPSDFEDLPGEICIDFGPDGTTFDKPVKIIIPYDQSITGDLTVFYYNSNDSVWEEVDVESVDTGNRTITAIINHFSVYKVKPTLAADKKWRLICTKFPTLVAGTALLVT